MVSVGLEMEGAQDLVNAATHLQRVDALVLKAKHDVRLDGGCHHLVVGILEDHGDTAADVLQRRVIYGHTVDAHGAGGGDKQPVETACQRRLAGAVGADEGRPSPRLEGDMHPAQSRNAGCVNVLHMVDFDHR